MSEKREIIAEYSVEVGKLIVDSSRIIEMRFNEEYLIDLNNLKEVQNHIDNLAKSNDLYILVIPGPGGNITKEAREAPMFENHRTKAIAIIATLMHQRILGNLYFKFRKAHFTNYKLFKSEQSAREWLLLQIPEKTNLS